MRIPPEIRSRLYSQGDVVPPVLAERLGPLGDAPRSAVEHLGQHWRRHRGEQRVERGNSCGPVDAVPVEPFGELFGLDGLSGAAAGEEPIALGMTGTVPMVTLADELFDEFAERAGNREQVVPDTEGEPAACGSEIAGLQSADAAHGQGIEEHETARHTIDQSDGVVSKKAREQVESRCFGDGAWFALSVDRQLQRGPSVGGDRPAQERPGLASSARSGCEPGIDVGLGGSDEVGAPGMQPVEEPDGDVGLGPGHRVAALVELVRLGQAGEPGPVMPTQIGGNETPVGGIVDGGKPSGGPTLEGGQVSVAGRQDAVGDEQLAQVFSAVSEAERVDAGVADWNLAGGQRADALDQPSVLEPRQSATWVLHGRQCLDEGNECRGDLCGPVVEEPVETTTQRAATATPQGVEVVVGTTAPTAEVLVDPGAVPTGRPLPQCAAGEGTDTPAPRAPTAPREPLAGTQSAECTTGPRGPLGLPAWLVFILVVRQVARLSRIANYAAICASSTSPAATASIVATASSVVTSRRWPLSMQNRLRHAQD